MSIEIISWHDLLEGVQGSVADEVAAYTQGLRGEKPQMLPVAPSDIRGKFAGAVALDGDSLAGYVGALKPEQHNGRGMSEAGSLWVPEEYRGNGIAQGLVSRVSAALVESGVQPYAFCNPLSLKIFEGAGYKEAEKGEISPAAFNACADCPMRPLSIGAACCDTLVIYEGKSS